MKRLALILAVSAAAAAAQEYGKEIEAAPVSVILLKYSDKLPGVPGGSPAKERTGVQVLVRTLTGESPIKEFKVTLKSKPAEGDEVTETVTGAKPADVDGRPAFSIFTFWTEGRQITSISVESSPEGGSVNVPLQSSGS